MSNESAAQSLTLLPDNLAVCRLAPDSPLPDWAGESSFFSITRTAEELSLVCETALVPAGITVEPGWRALKVVGPLDFSLTGVLTGLLIPLAEAGVSIFALSTFDTDYILVKEAQLQRALDALRSAGHRSEPG